MSTHKDSIQGAVVGAAAVVCALLDGAFDALVCILVHVDLPPFFEITSSMLSQQEDKTWKTFPIYRLHSA